MQYWWTVVTTFDNNQTSMLITYVQRGLWNTPLRCPCRMVLQDSVSVRLCHKHCIKALPCSLTWDLSEYKNYWSEAHFWGRGQCVSIEFLMRKCFEQNSLWNDDSRDRSLLMWSKINTINFQPRKYSHFQVLLSLLSFLCIFPFFKEPLWCFERFYWRHWE